ncbi:MAG: hypothetical protein JWN04_6090 [Myxococcaceae bacterium]|nr:hypothetical protein [Myxococcaceae bacterium]
MWAVVAMAWSGAARASADDAEPQGYRAAVDQALGEYDAKNYEEASALFARAHAIFPNARTERGLGMAAFELRRYDESAARLEAALASKVKPLEGELRVHTEALLARARGFLALVNVVLDPKTAQLLVDENYVTAPGPLNLRLGEHVLEARAEGYTPAKKVLRVQGGEVLNVQLTLQRELLAGPPVERPHPLYKNPWLWSGVGAVVLAGAIAGIVLATRDHSDTRTVGAPSANTPPGVMLSSLGGR